MVSYAHSSAILGQESRSMPLASDGRLDLVRVSIQLGGLDAKEDQEHPADHRKEVQELPPSTAVDVVQATRCNRDAGRNVANEKTAARL
jgi:hypothetical protein